MCVFESDIVNKWVCGCVYLDESSEVCVELIILVISNFFVLEQVHYLDRLHKTLAFKKITFLFPIYFFMLHLSIVCLIVFHIWDSNQYFNFKHGKKYVANLNEMECFSLNLFVVSLSHTHTHTHKHSHTSTRSFLSKWKLCSIFFHEFGCGLLCKRKFHIIFNSMYPFFVTRFLSLNSLIHHPLNNTLT